MSLIAGIRNIQAVNLIAITVLTLLLEMAVRPPLAITVLTLMKKMRDITVVGLSATTAMEVVIGVQDTKIVHHLTITARAMMAGMRHTMPVNLTAIPMMVLVPVVRMSDITAVNLTAIPFKALGTRT